MALLDESRGFRDADPVGGGDVGDAKRDRRERGRVLQELEPEAPQSVSPVSEVRVQRSVITFLPGFGYGWLKYCAIVKLWGWLRIILRVILEN